MIEALLPMQGVQESFDGVSFHLVWSLHNHKLWSAAIILIETRTSTFTIIRSICQSSTLCRTTECSMVMREHSIHAAQVLYEDVIVTAQRPSWPSAIASRNPESLTCCLV
jgi:hypothetical protein